jgi:hypothetical protein
MKRYLISLVNALISGAVTGIASSQIFHGTAKQNLLSAGVAAAASGAKWYLQHPIPGGLDNGNGQSSQQNGGH